MSIRTAPFISGAYYHIFNRGNDKREIFHDDDDRHRFVKLLYTSNSDKNLVIRKFDKYVYDIKRGARLVSVGAYCLMPNHFHLLIMQTESGDVSRFVHKLCTSYSMYYNNKYSRSGKLFEGKFKSEYADSDKYLKYLFSYIHLNPLKLVDKNWNGHPKLADHAGFLGAYKFSSYLDYDGLDRPDKVILDKEDFPDYFLAKGDFQAEMYSWLHDA